MSEQPQDRPSGPEVVGRPLPSSPEPTVLADAGEPQDEADRQALDTIRSISRLEESN